MMETKDLKVKEIAEKIIKNTRDGIMLKMKFLDFATNNLTINTSDDIPIGTDGKNFLYNEYFVINAYKTNINWINRTFLHSMLHCILKHMYQSKIVNQILWNLSCDICVENIINNINNSILYCGDVNEQLRVINDLRKVIKHITAENIYEYLLSNDISSDKLYKWQLLFSYDNHDLWYIPGIDNKLSYKQDNSDNKPSDKQDDSDNKPSDKQDDSDNKGEETLSSMEGVSSDNLTPSQLFEDIVLSNNQDTGIGQTQDNTDSNSIKWDDIANTLKMDMETFSNSIGVDSADMLDNLKEVTREKYDYTEFLKKFAVHNEIMKVNDDEFDYVYYTYGLNLYKDMPLVEPLEYKEVKQIKEFVIAIDTSGSTSGKLVKTFINKTFNILCSGDSVASRTKICLVECDCKIKNVTTINKQSDIDEYMKDFKIHGGGGTNFVPVFDYIDDLIKQKYFNNLKGMIYFTDGYGYFPKKKPNYDVCFAFIEGEDFNDRDVPSWAIKLILKQNDILD